MRRIVEPKDKFNSIAAKLSAENKYVSEGRMMSSPGIKYKNKVFAFYYNEEMAFRLGKEYDPREDSIEKFSLLNPFKTKPPLTGWFVIAADYHAKWEKLSKKALKKLKSDVD